MDILKSKVSAAEVEKFFEGKKKNLALIPDVAFEIQNKVKKAVESMTGLKVVEVNVHIQGVSTENMGVENDKEEDKE